MLNRRDLIKLGLYGGTAGMLHLTRLDSGVLAWALDEFKGTRISKVKLSQHLRRLLVLCRCREQ